MQSRLEAVLKMSNVGSFAPLISFYTLLGDRGRDANGPAISHQELSYIAGWLAFFCRRRPDYFIARITGPLHDTTIGSADSLGLITRLLGQQGALSRLFSIQPSLSQDYRRFGRLTTDAADARYFGRFCLRHDDFPAIVYERGLIRPSLFT